MSETAPTYEEHERKYLLHDSDYRRIPDALLMAPAKRVEQYYLNRGHEPYELRLRRTTHGDQQVHVATVKKGDPPLRLEMETPVSAETYQLWQEAALTEVITKQRRTLEMTAGHWALDSFTDLKMSLLEAEGTVPLPDFGRDVTDDTRFTNYELAQLNDVTQGVMPDSFKRPEQATELTQIRALIEHRRQKVNRPVVVGIAGDTASGKTTVAKQIAKPYGNRAVIISQDDYYHGVTKLREMYGKDFEVNFDDPISINSALLAAHIQKLKQGDVVQRPTYSMATSDPTGEVAVINPTETPILIVEGIHALDPELTESYDLSLFVNAPLATRVGRRLERDLAEGRSFKPEDNLRYLMEVAEPTYRPYGLTQKAAAEIIYHT